MPRIFTNDWLSNISDGKTIACDPKVFATKPCRKRPKPSVETTQPMLSPLFISGRIAIRSTTIISTAVSSVPATTASAGTSLAVISVVAVTAPTISSDPWPKFMVRVVQNVSDRPIAINA